MPIRCQSLLRLAIFRLLALIGIVPAAAVVSLTVPASLAFERALLARVLAFAGLLLAVFSTWAAPSIGLVQITPNAIAAGAPTIVRVTAVIADPTVIPSTVNLQRVNDAGAAVAVLGSLHDDGLNGDAVAGDQVYTLDVVFTESAPLRLRVSAGFKGMLKRVFSAEVLLPINRPPLADAGPDQSVGVGKPVSLDGSASRDPEGATLSHAWLLIGRPAGSAATLAAANSVRPTFTADVPGQYVAQLVVSDGQLASAPDTVRITATDTRLTILYLHADHLGTPRVATNEANVVVWRNPPTTEPFGMALPEEDPDGDGKPTIINLRFPGQYFDRETQLHYNYYRDYDPGVGRYVQPDPIGLAGGLNPYTHVRGNPLSYTDPTGLNPLLGLFLRLLGIGATATSVANDPVPIIGRGLGRSGSASAITSPTASSVASEICSSATLYGPLNQGPLAAGIANTFRSGTYAGGNLAQAQTMYRVIGPGGNPAGLYWTLTPPSGPVASTITNALLPQWGNNAARTVIATIPAGTNVYVGIAAQQGGLVGGGVQVYVPQINPAWLPGIR